MKSSQAQLSFCQQLMLYTASASATTRGVITSAVLFQDMAFSSINTLEKQAKYEQEEQKHSFQPSRQSKRPFFTYMY